MPAKCYIIFACFFIYTCSNAEGLAPQKTLPQQPEQALKAKVYVGSYSIPTMLKTGKEKLGARGGKLRIPELAIIKTETIKINGRQATKKRAIICRN